MTQLSEAMAVVTEMEQIESKRGARPETKLAPPPAASTALDAPLTVFENVALQDAEVRLVSLRQVEKMYEAQLLLAQRELAGVRSVIRGLEAQVTAISKE